MKARPKLANKKASMPKKQLLKPGKPRTWTSTEDTLSTALDAMGVGAGLRPTKTAKPTTIAVGNSENPSAVAEQTEKPRGERIYQVTDVALGNVMICTVTVSHQAFCEEVVLTLQEGPFDLMIVQPTPAGYNKDVLNALDAAVAAVQAAADGDNEPMEQLDAVVRDLVETKSIHEVMPSTFVVAHRKKIHSVKAQAFLVPQSRRKGCISQKFGGLQLGYVRVQFLERNSYLQLTHMKLLVCYFPHYIADSELKNVVDTVLRLNVSMLCGFWGPKGVNTTQVQKLAALTMATADGALTNSFSASRRSRGMCGTILKHHGYEQLETVHFPSYYVLFGPVRTLQSRRDTEPAKWDELVEFNKDWATDISDITALLSRAVPLWKDTAEGSPFTPHLGNVKLKPVIFTRWRPGTIQVPLWLGRTIPSKFSREKHKREQSAIWYDKLQALKAKRARFREEREREVQDDLQ